MFEAWIGHPDDGLSLRAEDRDGFGSAVSVVATLRKPGLEARQLVVHHYANGFDELVEFFASLERDWKGWSGSRTFESLEQDLTITATHDGHVQLVVRLRAWTVADGWDASAKLRLDPGEQLSAVVSDLREVLNRHP
ncbi:MAG TPA: DUF6228 family protein [Actinomycetes bacterium]